MDLHLIGSMSLKELNQSISVSIAINIALATAVSFIADTTLFPSGFIQKISGYYGLSIIFLLLIYVFLQLNQRFLSKVDLQRYNVFILFNLVLTTVFLAFIMYPRWINFGFVLLVMTVCITYNLLIPMFFILGSLLWKTFVGK